MTIPTRPAPPPPKPSSGFTQSQASSSSTSKFIHKKPAPPRPPPPKVTTSAPLKKSGSQKSISILSNLFGASKHKASEKLSHTSSEQRIPPKIPAPPPVLSRHHNTHQASNNVQLSKTNNAQLINFDESPAPSPPTIKKSNTGSDSASMDSFCSSTSSPNILGFGSGTTSQAESGFEDDFSVSDFKLTSGSTTRSTTFSSDPFDCLDDFAAPVKTSSVSSNIRNVKPSIQPKPSFGGASNFYTSTGSVVPSPATSCFDDSLSNGKNLIKPSSFNMPTIIKPPTAVKGKVSPTSVASQELFNTMKTAPILNHQSSDESCEDDLPSLPMPSIPPPPPPQLEESDEDEEHNPYGIALYDFESDVVEDLNLRSKEKVYLIKQMNDEWMFGRNKRGCEGIFPISYVEIRVPLKQEEQDSGTASRSASVSPAVEAHHVRALYNFNAETDEDLTIKENEIINVIYEINSEWLYGSNSLGDYGQFPANFIEYVPQNLPLMPK